LQPPDFFKKYRIKGRIACAVSGGIDSLAMVLLLKNSHDIVALIVDHSLRKESAKEAARAAQILTRLGVENKILKKKNSIKANLQEEARKLRYGLLVDYCKKHKIKYLATAHHAEDNAETFLLRLARGSGLDGLSAIPEISEINGVRIIRPLLDHTKAGLKKILVENKIKWVEDPTNKGDKYKRNRLRHALDALEDKDLITTRINDAAINLARVRHYIEGETDKAFISCVTVQRRNARLDTQKFKKLHEEIAYRVLVTLIMRLAKPQHRPRFAKLKRLKTDILTGKTRTLNGLIFRPISKTKGADTIITIEKKA
jgi:tRNA(Ile)-lysidine synthase